jgi:hypothetical protein
MQQVTVLLLHSETLGQICSVDAAGKNCTTCMKWRTDNVIKCSLHEMKTHTHTHKRSHMSVCKI